MSKNLYFEKKKKEKKLVSSIKKDQKKIAYQLKIFVYGLEEVIWWI